MSHKRTRLSWAAMMVVVALMGAACSPAVVPVPTLPPLLSTSTDTVPAPADTATPAVTPIIPNTGATAEMTVTVPATTTQSAAVVMVSQNATLGPILTNASGMTLYVFLNDQPDVSNCTGDCATAWPPLTVADGTVPAASADAMVTLGTVKRADGTLQVTVNHMPVYFWASDTKAGDATGFGVGNVWYVLDASGNVVKSAPSATPAAPAAAGSSIPDVDAATNATFGQILTDAKGLTLYVFAKDTPGLSNCSGACAAAWPPLTVGAGITPTLGEGVMGAVGTLQRADGTVQVTINNLPVYHFAKDANPGDTNGEGIGGAWYVLGADGNMLKGGTPAPAATPTGMYP
jgi:predicted lipoprotein with Yx(FWY)xxD motif